MLAIQIKNISKSYASNIALDNVNINFQSNQIHALVGENGAGKSTLFKIIAQFIKANQGQVLCSEDKQELGKITSNDVGLVMQDTSFIREFSIIENFAMSRKSLGKINWHEFKQEINQLLQEYNVNVDVDQKASKYDTSTIQLLEIIRLLYCGKKIILLDEPTANLNLSQIEKLFSILKTKQKNHTIIFSTHKIIEAYEYANYIHVLRKAKHIKSIAKLELKNQDEIIKYMFTKDVTIEKITKQSIDNETVFEIKDLITSYNLANKLNLAVNSKEVVAIIGLAQNGQQELFDCICGLSKSINGEVLINNKTISKENLYSQAMARIPQNPVETSAMIDMNLCENLFIHKFAIFKRFVAKLLNWQQMHKITNEIITNEDLATKDSYAKFSWLSGGNQRKLLISREIYDLPKILIAHNLEAGLDLQAVNKVIKTIEDLQSKGTGVLIFAQDLDFVAKIANRIILITNGKLQELNPDSWQETYQVEITK